MPEPWNPLPGLSPPQGLSYTASTCPIQPVVEAVADSYAVSTRPCESIGCDASSGLWTCCRETTSTVQPGTGPLIYPYGMTLSVGATVNLSVRSTHIGPYTQMYAVTYSDGALIALCDENYNVHDTENWDSECHQIAGWPPLTSTRLLTEARSGGRIVAYQDTWDHILSNVVTHNRTSARHACVPNTEPMSVHGVRSTKTRKSQFKTTDFTIVDGYIVPYNLVVTRERPGIVTDTSSSPSIALAPWARPITTVDWSWTDSVTNPGRLVVGLWHDIGDELIIVSQIVVWVHNPMQGANLTWAIMHATVVWGTGFRPVRILVALIAPNYPSDTISDKIRHAADATVGHLARSFREIGPVPAGTG